MGDVGDVLDRLCRWAVAQPLVRALVLESSRAVAGAPLDRFSDYDVLLIVSDVRPFVEAPNGGPQAPSGGPQDDAWLENFGPPVVRFRDAKETWGIRTYTRLVLYRDGTKIDYSIWPVELARLVVERGKSPDLLDWGYRVLVDEDGLTTGFPAPTRTAHIPARPTEREYFALVEEFWWESIYVAKNLWRDELVHARYCFDVVMRHELLVRMLEWRVEIDRGWSWKPGPVGRGLKAGLPPELWSELEATFVGPGLEENWEALFRMTALFRRAATEVGAALGYAYPSDLDAGVTAYLRGVRETPR